MTFFLDSMDDLNESLVKAEHEKDSWHPVGDILIENLQFEIEKTKVSKDKQSKLWDEKWYTNFMFKKIKVSKINKVNYEINSGLWDKWHRNLLSSEIGKIQCTCK